ncbi:preprotein translocase subunit YajC [Streptococcus porci]|uniref:preprotein translocase subunit YajC n=1 Tax=Streptococcus porci TaxID=502567 RepID=UPI0003F60217|nr:preprotein translocase subunit YajC [Streptococcus porci]
MNPTILIMLVMMAGMMYFTSRSQKKQAQQRQNQLSQLKKGDEVVTIGGMYATVDEVNVEAKTIVLDVDGVYLTFELSAIKRVITPTASDLTPIVADGDSSAVEEVE